MGIYQKYYGLNADPFHITPDPSVLLLTESHRNAIGAIGYGICDRKGFVVVTGEVGVGKTTALRACLDELPEDKTKVIYIFNPKISSDALYATIVDSLDMMDEASSDRPVDAIQNALLAYYRDGVNVILAVDEAQHMPAETLESLRLLSNLETTSQKLLQIILVGQPELNEILGAYNMRQLDQRIAVRAHMVPLGFSQSLRYIRHRLALSGWSGQDDLFTLPAACYIAWHAHGIPRKLNIHCDNALANGYGMTAKRITLRIARIARVELPKRRTKPQWAAVCLAGAVCLAVAAWGLAVVAAPEPMRAWWVRSLSGLDARIGEMKPGGAKATASEPPAPPSAPPAPIALAATDRPPPDPLRPDPAPPVVLQTIPPVAAADLPAPAAPGPPVQVVSELQPVPIAQPETAAPPVDRAGPQHAPDQDRAAIRLPLPATARTVTARTGDTLIRLCAEAYGRCTRDLLLSLAKANQIAEPDLLISGKVLAIPPLRSNAPRRAGQESESP